MVTVNSSSPSRYFVDSAPANESLEHAKSVCDDMGAHLLALDSNQELKDIGSWLNDVAPGLYSNMNYIIVAPRGYEESLCLVVSPKSPPQH